MEAKHMAEKKVETLIVALARDTWDQNEIRQVAGSLIEVPLAAAMKGLQAGIYLAPDEE